MVRIYGGPRKDVRLFSNEARDLSAIVGETLANGQSGNQELEHMLGILEMPRVQAKGIALDQFNYAQVNLMFGLTLGDKRKVVARLGEIKELEKSAGGREKGILQREIHDLKRTRARYNWILAKARAYRAYLRQQEYGSDGNA